MRRYLPRVMSSLVLIVNLMDAISECTCVCWDGYHRPPRALHSVARAREVKWMRMWDGRD